MTGDRKIRFHIDAHNVVDTFGRFMGLCTDFHLPTDSIQTFELSGISLLQP